MIDKNVAITSEEKIANKLFVKLISISQYCCNNCYYFGYQIDFIQISNYGYITEYEIKTNLKDFKKEEKKTVENISKTEYLLYGNSVNKFIYVIPEFLVPDVINTISKKFGLISYNKNFDFKTIKSSDLLHKNISNYLALREYILEKTYKKYKLWMSEEF